ncbi:MAG: type IV secretory system conjugative DNA transfer family protein [Alphaproteobacteria bacterium]|nr:type IV secretory system conjugative DNA transfer family protein [Alphaproteobacteria bacterium]
MGFWSNRALAVRGSAQPSPIKLGLYCDHATGKTGDSNLYHGERHVLIHGLNGAGKSTRFLIELLMTSTGRSIVVFDIKGELAAQTADYRRASGNDVKIIAPWGTVGLSSDGYNPMSSLDPDNHNEFFGRAALHADATIEMEGDSQRYWSESAQGMMQGAEMFEAIAAKRSGRMPSLLHVRQLLCEPDEFETVMVGGKRRRRQSKGLAVNCARMIHYGGPAVAGLVGRFVREHGQNELASIQSTFDTHTRFLLAPPIARDFQRGRWDFRQLRQRPTTVYIVLPAEAITAMRRWTRLLITEALCAHFRPGPVPTLFILDEFYAAVGHLKIIADVWSLVRGYGVQLMPIVQSALQLQALYKTEWENFAAQAGMVATIGPAGDTFSAEFFSKRSGNTTMLQYGFNLGDGESSGDGLNTGTGTSGVNFSTNQGSGRNWGRNTSGGFNVAQIERRAFLPQDFMDLQPGYGRMWLPGMGTKSIPFFAPNYWKYRSAPWVRHVRPNPYRTG